MWLDWRRHKDERWRLGGETAQMKSELDQSMYPYIAYGLLWFLVFFFSGMNDGDTSVEYSSLVGYVWSIIAGLSVHALAMWLCRRLGGRIPSFALLGDNHYLNFFALQILVMPWIIVALSSFPHLCGVLDTTPDEQRLFISTVTDIDKPSDPLSGRVSVRDKRGVVRRLEMGRGNVPPVGEKVIFTAKEGLFGVLYDISFAKSKKPDK